MELGLSAGGRKDRWVGQIPDGRNGFHGQIAAGAGYGNTTGSGVDGKTITGQIVQRGSLIYIMRRECSHHAVIIVSGPDYVNIARDRHGKITQSQIPDLRPGIEVAHYTP